MAGKQAKILAPASLELMLEHVSASPYPERARVMILLSAKAGLRAGEIAGLTWDMILDSRGRVGAQSISKTELRKCKAEGVSQ